VFAWRIFLCVWMCGGGGGERRALYNNHLTGAVPSELGRLTKLRGLCVQPASPPNLECGVSYVGEQVHGW
jgi:hypothetical protein